MCRNLQTDKGAVMENEKIESMIDEAVTHMSEQRPLKWGATIDISDDLDATQDGNKTVEELAKILVTKLRELKQYDDDADFQSLIDDMEMVEDVEGFDYTLSDLYDWGDIDKRLFIKTF